MKYKGYCTCIYKDLAEERRGGRRGRRIEEREEGGEKGGGDKKGRCGVMTREQGTLPNVITCSNALASSSWLSLFICWAVFLGCNRQQTVRNWIQPNIYLAQTHTSTHSIYLVHVDHLGL